MNKKHKVIWSNIAENDLTNIIEYIAVDSTSDAVKIFKKKGLQIFITPLSEAV